MAFLLGGLVKDKARFHQLQRHEQPEKVVVKLSELEDKVCLSTVLLSGNILMVSKAKEHDIFDVSPFLRSKLFKTNGYILKDKTIEKHFRVD